MSCKCNNLYFNVINNYMNEKLCLKLDIGAFF